MGKRVILIVIDSLGVGHMEDVKDIRPQDIGANTLKHILDKSSTIEIPMLEMLGINSIIRHEKLKKIKPAASFGVLNLMHEGADSYAGHQEIMGTFPKKSFRNPFKDYLLPVKDALINDGYKVEIPDSSKPYLLVNELVIIADNIETDYGQIYNISAPLDYIDFDDVLKIASFVRKEVKVNRVIALGGSGITVNDLINSVEQRDDGLVGVNSPASGVYRKGYNVRHIGYGVNPETQISSILKRSGKETVLIGKMQDVIECKGAIKYSAVDTEEVMIKIIEAMPNVKEGLIAATVQETDLAGHSQDVEGYANKLNIVDKYLREIVKNMTLNDMLMVTADHGNDPTIGHSQHTREKTPLLIYSKSLSSRDIGERKTLSDIAATIADLFKVNNPESGESILPIITSQSK